MQCIDENFKKSLFLYKKVQASLPDLAFFIIHHNKNDQIKGIIGITMIDKGYKRLGFESFSLSSHSYLWFKRIAHYPIHLLSSSKPSSKGKKCPLLNIYLCQKTLYVRNMVHSQRLLRKYLKAYRPALRYWLSL